MSWCFCSLWSQRPVPERPERKVLVQRVSPAPSCALQQGAGALAALGDLLREWHGVASRGRKASTVFPTAPPFPSAQPPAPGTAGSSCRCPETQLGWRATTCVHTNPEAWGLPTGVLSPRG